MAYMSEFFSTLDEAKTFQMEYGGEILEFTAKGHKVTGMNDYKFEAFICGMSREEMLKHPYCVVWNWKYSSDCPAQSVK